MQEEQVLVVPTELFRQIGLFQGFCRNADRYRRELLAPRNVSFMPRGEAEQQPDFKQLIPYMIFRHVDSEGVERIFQYIRGKGMGESRLHSKRSIGVGGHLSLEDRAQAKTNHDLYREGMLRELREEVVLETTFEEECVGLINDDESEVGQVHLGIVHLFTLTEAKLRSNEPDLIEAGFVPVTKLLRDLDNSGGDCGEAFETWSAIALRELWG